MISKPSEPFAYLAHEINNPRVMAAMNSVPRHEFVPEAHHAEAYKNRPLSIGYNQTISQPFIVAYMTAQLEPRSTDRVLEIGTGCGYQAAILSRLVREVFSVEIIPELARQAAENCRRLSYENVCVRCGDGYQGWPEAAPFDAIIIPCASDRVPPPLIKQLKEGGRIIMPIGGEYEQILRLWIKHHGELAEQSSLAVRFVPMTGEARRN